MLIIVSLLVFCACYGFTLACTLEDDINTVLDDIPVFLLNLFPSFKALVNAIDDDIIYSCNHAPLYLLSSEYMVGGAVLAFVAHIPQLLVLADTHRAYEDAHSLIMLARRLEVKPSAARFDVAGLYDSYTCVWYRTVPRPSENHKPKSRTRSRFSPRSASIRCAPLVTIRRIMLAHRRLVILFSVCGCSSTAASRASAASHCATRSSTWARRSCARRTRPTAAAPRRVRRHDMRRRGDGGDGEPTVKARRAPVIATGTNTARSVETAWLPPFVVLLISCLRLVGCRPPPAPDHRRDRRRALCPPRTLFARLSPSEVLRLAGGALGHHRIHRGGVAAELDHRLSRLCHLRRKPHVRAHAHAGRLMRRRRHGAVGPRQATTTVGWSA